ncbi:hypothetical protein [Lysobacter brunescens]|uniref:DUF4395 domain-containing protein n=1 Tax=Lysobacter brunescens TaxID=262323 RepID=A0ABW2YEP0_9GAMM
MSPDHILALAHLAIVFAAIVGWLTAGAKLAEMHPGLTILATAWRVTAGACIHGARFGLHAIDTEAWRRAIRPVVRAITAALVFAAAPAALFELLFTGVVGPFGAALVLCLALEVATTTPCPWIRYVFIGERRRVQRPFKGEDRRAR